MACFQSQLRIAKTPRYNWNIKKSVFRSGWNPVGGLKVSLNDLTLSDNSVTLIIEPPAPGFFMFFVMAFTPLLILSPVLVPIVVRASQARGFFFTLSETNDKVNLMYRIKPFAGETEEGREGTIYIYILLCGTC